MMSHSTSPQLPQCQASTFLPALRALHEAGKMSMALPVTMVCWFSHVNMFHRFLFRKFDHFFLGRPLYGVGFKGKSMFMDHYPRHCCHVFRSHVVPTCFYMFLLPSFIWDFAPGTAAVRCGDLPLDESDSIVTRMKSLGCTWYSGNVIQIVIHGCVSESSET